MENVEIAYVFLWPDIAIKIENAGMLISAQIAGGKNGMING